MKIRNMVVALVLAMVLTVAGLTGVYFGLKAMSVPNLKWGDYVYDQAKCISREDESTLNSLLAELQRETDANFYVISMVSRKKVDVAEYAEKAFKAMGLNAAGARENVLLCFSRNEKKLAVMTTEGLKEVLDERTIGQISSRYYDSYLKDYSKAIEGTTTSMALAVASHYDADVTNLRFSSPYGNAFLEFAIIIGVLILCLIAIIFLSNTSCKKKSRKR